MATQRRRQGTDKRYTNQIETWKYMSSRLAGALYKVTVYIDLHYIIGQIKSTPLVSHTLRSNIPFDVLFMRDS